MGACGERAAALKRNLRLREPKGSLGIMLLEMR